MEVFLKKGVKKKINVFYSVAILQISVPKHWITQYVSPKHHTYVDPF